jgi:hypothetical protein
MTNDVRNWTITRCMELMWTVDWPWVVRVLRFLPFFFSPFLIKWRTILLTVMVFQHYQDNWGRCLLSKDFCLVSLGLEASPCSDTKQGYGQYVVQSKPQTSLSLLTNRMLSYLAMKLLNANPSLFCKAKGLTAYLKRKLYFISQCGFDLDFPQN